MNSFWGTKGNGRLILAGLNCTGLYGFDHSDPVVTMGEPQVSLSNGGATITPTVEQEVVSSVLYFKNIMSIATDVGILNQTWEAVLQKLRQRDINGSAQLLCGEIALWIPQALNVVGTMQKYLTIKCFPTQQLPSFDVHGNSDQEVAFQWQGQRIE